MGRITGLVLTLMLIPTMCFGQMVGPMMCSSSGTISADGSVAGATKFCGILIDTDGSTDATVIAYNGTSAVAGTEIFDLTITGADDRGGAAYGFLVNSPNGIYVDIGDADGVIVYYQ